MEYAGEDLPPLRGIDPLHPLMDAFSGTLEELEQWSLEAPPDPFDGVYLYVFLAARDTLHVGVARSTQFVSRHLQQEWWPRASRCVVYRVDCRWHQDPECGVPVCTSMQLDAAAFTLQGWMAGMLTPVQRTIR